MYKLFCDFLLKGEKVVLKAYSVNECKDGTNNVVFNNESIDGVNLKDRLYKYFIYNTNNKDKFEVDKKFKVYMG